MWHAKNIFVLFARSTKRSKYFELNTISIYVINQKNMLVSLIIKSDLFLLLKYYIFYLHVDIMF